MQTNLKQHVSMKVAHTIKDLVIGNQYALLKSLFECDLDSPFKRDVLAARLKENQTKAASG